MNVAFIVIGFWTGYGEMAPERLRGTNPDQYLCLSLVLVTPLLVLGGLYLANRESFRRPSFSRFSLSWRRDPPSGAFHDYAGDVRLGSWLLCKDFRVWHRRLLDRRNFLEHIRWIDFRSDYRTCDFSEKHHSRLTFYRQAKIVA
jgi:hypothetical protein